MKTFVLMGLVTLALAVKIQGQAKYTSDDFAAMSVADASRAINSHEDFGRATFEDLARAALQSQRMDLIAFCLSDHHLGPFIYELTTALPESAFTDRVQVMMLNSGVLWGPDANGGAASVKVAPNETGPRDAQIPRADPRTLTVGPAVSGMGIAQGITNLMMGPDLDKRVKAFMPMIKRNLPGVVLTAEMLKTSAARSKLAADLEAVMPKEPAPLLKPVPADRNHAN